ncbi:heme-dependent peroxidase [Alicyclobacillus fastidiosus]|uniref:Coproheme decarboxylase n=1 Tax=Alicyclobacillus fastidiosus TaxID=392011 RepID=A0ABY6ZNB1_9BACL|nr:hydrogen peroxide-dependent heme synthase [Alicyclobacillus fastidiosus]WAH44327.1 heme-dependent peroxidase [Alicyclobacillus fastidiosus]GMA60655.1 putative heme-dependent peroxidase YwfI [Alicyclobacillus fastidiosus]
MSAPITLDGWYVYHEFRTIRWDRWKSLSEGEQHFVLREWNQFADEQRKLQDARQGSFGQFIIAGSKADLLVIHMRPTIEELSQLKAQMARTRLFSLSDSTYSYISVVELGGYNARPGVDIEQDEALQARLKPSMPTHSHICFYPMNKRRLGQDNWFMLSEEERREFMKAHGMIGRQYAGIVKQIISGSVGLDDWEWGVTLFANDPLQFKKLVYEMRFDESSARFAEFGPFYVGHQVDDRALGEWLIGVPETN